MKNNISAVFLFLCMGLFAHPHMWIDVDFDLHWENEALTRLDVHWVFDIAFTEQILWDFDANQDRRITGSEAAEIKQYAFDNLRSLDYLIILAVNQVTQTMPAAENFKAWIEDDILHYTFTLNFAQPYKNFVLTIADETNYIAMTVMSLDNFGQYLAGLTPQEVYVDLGIITALAYAY